MMRTLHWLTLLAAAPALLSRAGQAPVSDDELITKLAIVVHTPEHAGKPELAAARAILFDPDRQLRRRAIGQALSERWPGPGFAAPVTEVDADTVRVDAGLVVGPSGLLRRPYTIRTQVVEHKGQRRYRLTVNGTALADYPVAEAQAGERQAAGRRDVRSIARLLSQGKLHAQIDGFSSSGRPAAPLERLVPIVTEAGRDEYATACALSGLFEAALQMPREPAMRAAASMALGPEAKAAEVEVLARRLRHGMPFFALRAEQGAFSLHATHVPTDYCVRKVAHYLGVQLVADEGLPPRVEDLRVAAPGLPREGFLRAFADRLRAKLARDGDTWRLSPLAIPVALTTPWPMAWQRTLSKPYLRPALGGGKVVLAIGGQTLAALDPETGKTLWGAKGVYIPFTLPVIADGAVYAGGGDNDMYAVRLSDGTKLWAYEAATPMTPTIGGEMKRNYTVRALGVAGDVALFESEDGRVYAVRRQQGTLAWKLRSPVGGSGCLADGVLYFVGGGKACAVEVATRRTLWTASGMPGGRAYKLGNYVSASGGGQVAALDARTGRRLWLAASDRKGRMNRPLALVGQRLVVPGGWDDNHVYGFDVESGKMLWQANVPGFPRNVTPWGSDKVLAPTNAGHLVALRADDGRLIADLPLGVSGTVAPLVAGHLLIVPGRDRMTGGSFGRGVLTAYRLHAKR